MDVDLFGDQLSSPHAIHGRAVVAIAEASSIRVEVQRDIVGASMTHYLFAMIPGQAFSSFIPKGHLTGCIDHANPVVEVVQNSSIVGRVVFH